MIKNNSFLNFLLKSFKKYNKHKFQKNNLINILNITVRCTNPRNYIVSEPIGLIEQNRCSEM